MKQDLHKIIRDFLDYFQVKFKDLNFLFNNTVPVVTLHDQSSTLEGLRNIVNLVSNSDKPEENVLHDEWVEYIQLHANHFSSPEILKELNEHLSDKTFFLNSKMGIIDILMFCFLYNVFLDMSFQEKEKYQHVSRWFNHIQHMTDYKLSKPVILFSRCQLYS